MNSHPTPDRGTMSLAVRRVLPGVSGDQTAASVFRIEAHRGGGDFEPRHEEQEGSIDTRERPGAALPVGLDTDG